MPPFFQLIIIAISLALDALSVSIAGGIKSEKAKFTHAMKVATFFGTFQAIMPLLGWIIGEVLTSIVSVYSHWIAFLLLLIIGIKMIKEAFDNDDKKKNILDNKTLIVLAIATSIDALVVGITLALLNIPLLLSIIVIGIITFILCFLGYLFGNQIGKIFGRKVEIIGGIALIAVGIKILLKL